MIAPQSESIIPVSCVEQGRWSYRSKNFESESRAMSPNLRKRKTETVTTNLRQGQEFMSDQGIVWDEIERKYQRMSASPSPTMAMADLYESQREATTEYLAAFRPVANQTGMIVFIDGHVIGFEILYRFGALRENHSKLINSYVMDALESVGVSEIQIRKSVALGNDIRMESGNQILQMTVFASKNGKVAGPISKMAGPQRGGNPTEHDTIVQLLASRAGGIEKGGASLPRNSYQ
jgi:hypothetical protein